MDVVNVGKLDANKKQKETSLFNTAFEFFTTKGFSKTSITDIVEKAGVAKGTFYLYFKDKYDILNKLISHKSYQIFGKAVEMLTEEDESLDLEDKIIKLADNIINQLNENKSLITFISKNLSWGIFKSALEEPVSDSDMKFRDIYYRMLEESHKKINDPEIMLFMIVELVSSTCFSAIIYSEPCGLETLKPHLYMGIRSIIRNYSE